MWIYFKLLFIQLDYFLEIKLQMMTSIIKNLYLIAKKILPWVSFCFNSFSHVDLNILI